MTDHRRLTKLSKFLALILRHQPERFALALDDEGWASLSEVLEILRGLPNFRWATRADVMAVVQQGSGVSAGASTPSSAEALADFDKRRFQVEGNRIRARYGHSLACPIRYEPCIPPARLYHGTSGEALASIRREGLRPMERQYVHLSPDAEMAVRIAVRHTGRPVVLTVRSSEAHAGGVEFYLADEAVYLAKQIPVEFLEFPAGQ